MFVLKEDLGFANFARKPLKSSRNRWNLVSEHIILRTQYVPLFPVSLPPSSRVVPPPLSCPVPSTQDPILVLTSYSNDISESLSSAVSDAITSGSTGAHADAPDTQWASCDRPACALDGRVVPLSSCLGVRDTYGTVYVSVYIIHCNAHMSSLSTPACARACGLDHLLTLSSPGARCTHHSHTKVRLLDASLDICINPNHNNSITTTTNPLLSVISVSCVPMYVESVRACVVRERAYMYVCTKIKAKPRARRWKCLFVCLCPQPIHVEVPGVGVEIPEWGSRRRGRKGGKKQT
ncbi:hypothetical protein B0H10DRAFT_458178 [Mycena sp. CBHHK59/15]|nr:hypothetical protein B0H10DRAFT_458178 [Mycena sp. CBHHK59/15]